MKKIINRGLDFYEKEFRDGCSFLEDLAGSPSSGVKLDSYIKELEGTNILFDDLCGRIYKDEDGEILQIFHDEIQKSSRFFRAFEKFYEKEKLWDLSKKYVSSFHRAFAEFYRDFKKKENFYTTLVKIIDVKIDENTYVKTDEKIFIEGVAEVFHLGKKEHWDSDDYMLMELGARNAIGIKLFDLFPDPKIFIEGYETRSDIVVSEFHRNKNLVTIRGKYGLHY